MYSLRVYKDSSGKTMWRQLWTEEASTLAEPGRHSYGAPSFSPMKMKKKDEEVGREVANPRQTLDCSNPRQNWYTLATQNGQPL